MTDFRVIQGCPCNAMIAPYYGILVKETHATVESIYRGDDAKAILHAHGKHTQSEVIRLHKEGVPGFGPANAVSVSTHCLFNDGVAYPNIRRGAHLEDWQEGIDARDSDVRALIARAKHYGWHLRQPYDSGSEFHHLNFAVRPVPHSAAMRARIILWRTRLPRR
jgi:hypothetical protein